MIKILNWLFGKRKDGKCRWWQHDIVTTHEEYMAGTGQYVNGKEIKKKMWCDNYKCTKCNYEDSGNYRRAWF